MGLAVDTRFAFLVHKVLVDEKSANIEIFLGPRTNMRI